MFKYKPNIQLPDNGYKLIFANIKKETPFNYAEFILRNESVDELYFIQQSGSGKYYDNLYKILEENPISKIGFYMSDFIIKMSKGTLPSIKKICDRFNGTLKFNTTHVKLILIKTKSNYYVINSTSNVDSNSKLEYTEMSNNKSTYDFFITFANKFFK